MAGKESKKVSPKKAKGTSQKVKEEPETGDKKARKLYGLLVGINDYPNPRHRLNGCVNDIEAFEQVLSKRFDKNQFAAIKLKTLKNSEATRQAVIENFRKHLQQAKEGDVALFYYSGHGAQERAPEAFWEIEPDRLNETLVCYDSRTPGGWDLADKELAKLISEVTKNNPHVVVILDCCHSGSGTRLIEMAETKVRKIETDTRIRPLNSYLISTDELEPLSTNTRSADDDGSSGWKALPEGKHILLAACQDLELAKEYNADGKAWGGFSYFLRKTLEESSQQLSYYELYRRTLARVSSSITDQRPQLEASTEANTDEAFLGGAISAKQSFLAFFDRQWKLDGGAVHGIAAPVGDEKTRVALFDKDVTAEHLREETNILAHAAVIDVQPDGSILELIGKNQLKTGEQYQAVITSLPLPPVPIRIEGEAEGIKLARAVLKNKASLYIREADKPEYRLLAKNKSYIIANAVDDRPLVKEIEGVSEVSAQKAIEQLEHIARWVKTRDLTNPTKLDLNKIKMIIHYEGKEYPDKDVTFKYKQKDQTWQNPTFKLELRNESDQTLYCSVLILSESFSISSGILPAGQVRLKPGEKAFGQVNGKQDIAASVPEKYVQAGITERKDVFKLIVSTEAFDAWLLEQAALEAPNLRSNTRSLGGRGNALERLMAKIQTREIGGEDGGSYSDWATKSISTVTVRPGDTQDIPNTGKGLELSGVVLQPHPSLKARAKLGTVNQLNRDLEEKRRETSRSTGNINISDIALPEILKQDYQISQPLQFTTARGQDPGLSVLELEVENFEAVTPDEPLRLSLDQALEKNEFILPFAFDGEHYIPLGYSRPGTGTRGERGTEIVLERLPDPNLKTIQGTPNTKSLFGSLKILFQKLKSDWLGTKFPYPILAAVTVPEDAQVSFDKHYERDVEKVKAKVKDAKRILLYVHGIIGDTLGMCASAQLAKVKQGDKEVPLKDTYDLILAYDYENIKTPIEENAKLLKQRLEEIGLSAGHGKTLHIVAHSMGGLVSRWFIEREGGNRVVERLVMLGTPNAGSPWPSVQDWATGMLTVGLNGISASHWTVGVLAKLGSILGAALEKNDVALDQMNAKSEFLAELAKSQDPKVSYSIIAGNTSLLNAEEAKGLLQKLKLVGYNALTKFLFDEPNDIAVGVSSVKQVEASRQPKPRVEEVASDHVGYFKIEESLKKLVLALETKMS